MLTKIGVQILDELKSELDTDVEDRKKHFMFIEAGNAVKSIWQLFFQFVHVLYLYLTLALVLAFVFIDESTIKTLASTPVREILGFRDTAVSIICMLSFWAILLIIMKKKLNNYRSAKEQYQTENKRFVNDTTRQIELIEEVLHRHNLINKKEL